jgi:hypothetical protein
LWVHATFQRCSVNSSVLVMFVVPIQWIINAESTKNFIVGPG